MENINTAPGSTNQSFTTPNLKIKTPKNIFKYLFFVSIIILIVISIYFYLSNKNINTKNLSIQSTNSSSEEINKVSPTTKTEIEWVRTNIDIFAGAYSFEYPQGWHIASIDSTFLNLNPPISNTIIINSNPINIVPKGGPLGDIVITDKSGLNNPEIIFQQDIEEFKKGKTDIKENIIQSGIGKIYHYTVKGYSEMGGDYSLETYYVFIDSKVSPPNDNINKHILNISSISPKYSDILNKIVLSIRPR